MSINAFDCPSCEDQLQAMSFNACAPALLDAGILYLLLARPDQPFANIEDPAEHTLRTNNASANADAVRRLKGVGSYTVEYGDSFTIGRDTYYNKNVGTLLFKIYDNNAVNYEFIRSLGCNTQFLAWPIDSQGNIYGGNDGMLVVLQGRENITDNVDEKKFLEVQGAYKHRNAAPRDAYPLAGDIDLDGNV